jgi:hypothetical protein
MLVLFQGEDIKHLIGEQNWWFYIGFYPDKLPKADKIDPQTIKTWKHWSPYKNDFWIIGIGITSDMFLNQCVWL